MRSEVQILSGPPFARLRGLSSAGRAVALQASGHRFDPDRLHQALQARSDVSQERTQEIPIDETKPDPASAGQAIVLISQRRRSLTL